MVGYWQCWFFQWMFGEMQPEQPILHGGNLKSGSCGSKLESEVTRMNEQKYWLAFLIGVAAGAATALLYAPQSGAKTRRQLRKSVENAGDYLENAGDYLKSQAERFSSEAQKTVERAKQRVGDVVDKAGDVASDAVKGAQSLV
jgi:gas vesicle protein